jgi:hypothetical protein
MIVYRQLEIACGWFLDLYRRSCRRFFQLPSFAAPWNVSMLLLARNRKFLLFNSMLPEPPPPQGVPVLLKLHGDDDLRDEIDLRMMGEN